MTTDHQEVTKIANVRIVFNSNENFEYQTEITLLDEEKVGSQKQNTNEKPERFLFRVFKECVGIFCGICGELEKIEKLPLENILSYRTHKSIKIAYPSYTDLIRNLNNLVNEPLEGEVAWEDISDDKVINGFHQKVYFKKVSPVDIIQDDKTVTIGSIDIILMVAYK